MLKKIINSSFKLLLSVLCFIAFNQAFAQVPVAAPNISYQSPQVYFINTTITPLAPGNTGGAVPLIFGQVSTLAGSGNAGKTDGPGASASFGFLGGPAVDNSGNIYIPDAGGNDLVRKVSPTGTVATFTSSGSAPTGIVIDAGGDLYVTEFASNIINRITAAGVQTIFAGTGNAGNKNGIGTAASFNQPRGIAIDQNSNLYVADSGNGLIRKISPAGVVTTLTNGIVSPACIAIDSKGNLFIADDNHNLIYKLDVSNNLSVFAGSGNAALIDGVGTGASFNHPQGLAIDALDNIFVGDYGNLVIRKITPSGVVSTFAGTGKSGATNGDLKSATFAQPGGLAIDNNGNLYVADNLNYMLRKISLKSYTIDKALPPGLFFDTTTGIISGTPTFFSPPTDYTITAYNSGGSSKAVVNIEVTTPVTLVVIPTKTICSPDFTPLAGGGNGVYTYTSSSTAVAVVVKGKIHVMGPGTTNITASDGSSSASQILTVLLSITPQIDITPDGSGTCEAQSLTYTASVINAGIDPIYQWKINDVNAGTNINYLTTNTLKNNDRIRCTVTDTSDCTIGPVSSNIITLIADHNVSPAVSIQSSVTGLIAPGTAITFTATPTNGGSAPLYQWAINGVNAGTNSPTFTYNCFADGDTVTCTLTSQGIKCVFPTSAQSKAITVNVSSSTLSITISALANNVYAGTAVTFTATVSGTGGIPSYNWFINNKTAGQNSATFTTTMLNNGDIVTCTVTDGTCNTQVTSNAITMMILPPLSFTIPNTFTPNGDNINDLWDIPYLNYYRNCTVSVFSRYGTLVFFSKGYPKPWDGTRNGSKLPVGTYYYVINLANNTPLLSGFVAIIR